MGNKEEEESTQTQLPENRRSPLGVIPLKDPMDAEPQYNNSNYGV